MAEGRWTQSMLLDFYGELLTEKQRECFDLHYNEDLSLSEIAEQLGISRQGVWDNIRRAESAMEAVEEKTGLLARFEENRRLLAELRQTLETLLPLTEGEARKLTEDAAERVELLISRG
ncbi:MAG: YlxM family DNA-binding protein [Oscillospiraceae bacterium]|nr:YlxM family DNA-binding protein [Oscillospiraceae bacterium]